MIHIQLYTYTCGSKINNNDERTHFFRKIYLSLYSKGLRKGCERVMCERWVGDWTNCNILTPSSFVFSSTSFSFCWATQSGVLRAHSPLLGAGSLYSILSPTNWLQLTELPVARGYIIVWHPPASCERRICTQFNPSTVNVIPWYLRPDAPVTWLTAGSKVNMLHIYKECSISLIIINLRLYSSPTISHHPSLSLITPRRSSRLHPVSAHWWCIYVLAGRLTLVRSCVVVHKRI